MPARPQFRLGVVALIWLATIGTAQAAPSIAEYTSGITGNQNPTSITAGPDGNLWFTESGGPGALARITPLGTVTEFTTGLSEQRPADRDHRRSRTATCGSPRRRTPAGSAGSRPRG